MISMPDIVKELSHLGWADERIDAGAGMRDGMNC